MPRTDMRVSETDLANWQRRAKEAGVTLSAWIRSKCDGVEPNYKPAATLKAQATPSKSKKTCVHGTERGYNCWQCGGAAKSE